jgi:hypothetical protein
MNATRSIDEIPDAADLTGAELLIVWQDGRTRRVTLAVLVAALAALLAAEAT